MSKNGRIVLFELSNAAFRTPSKKIAWNLLKLLKDLAPKVQAKTSIKKQNFRAKFLEGLKKKVSCIMKGWSEKFLSGKLIKMLLTPGFFLSFCCQRNTKVAKLVHQSKICRNYAKVS